MSETVAINLLDFYTPLMSSSRDQDSWWGRVTLIASDYLAPLSYRSSYSGYQARVLDVETGHCRLEPREASDWVVTAVKVASYASVLLPVVAALIKVVDRVAHNYHFKVDEALSDAFEHEDTELLWRLFEQGTVEAKDLKPKLGSATHAVHLFSKKGNAECLQRLLDKGADSAAFDDDGLAPIHIAAAADNIEALRVLLDAGVSVSMRTGDDKDNSPLHVAGEKAAAVLLQANADPEQLNAAYEKPKTY